MELLSGLALGFGAVLSEANLIFCVAGALIGVVAAILPGISPAAMIALALPLSFAMPSAGAIASMFSMAVGSLYGRATASLLLAGLGPSPGGRSAGQLAATTLASLFGGAAAAILAAALVLAVPSPARSFGPAELAALQVLVLVVATAAAPGRISRAVAVVALGLLLGMVGTDRETGAARLTFGLAGLADGLGVTSLVFGMFVVADVIRGLAAPDAARSTTGGAADAPAPGIVGASLLGVLAGFFPASGTSLTFAADDKEAVADPLDPAGRNSIEQITRAAAANSARLTASFLPLLCLGVPTNAVAVLLVGLVVVHAGAPGAQAATSELFWAVPAAVLIAHAVLPAIVLITGRGLAVLSRVNYRSLAPVILVYACFATYMVNNSAFDVFLMAGFAALGYVFTRSGCERGLFLLAFVMGPPLEENLRRTLLIARGDFFGQILHRPMVGALLGAAIVLALGALTWRRKAGLR